MDRPDRNRATNAWQLVRTYYGHTSRGSLLPDELQAHRVDAIPQPRRFRSILEHLAEVCITTSARGFGTYHAEGAVLVVMDGVLAIRLEEAAIVHERAGSRAKAVLPRDVQLGRHTHLRHIDQVDTFL